MNATREQMSYRILCNGTLIGHSDLEGEDPGMGVAYGRFVPTTGYEQFQRTFRLRTEAESDTSAQPNDPEKLDRYRQQLARLRLTLQTSGGVSISTSWIEVRDFSSEAGKYEVSAQVDDPTFFVDGESIRNPRQEEH